MAPKPPVVEDLESTYHYLYVKQSDVDLFKLGYFEENHIPISVIGLWSTGPHASGTGYLTPDYRATHPNIAKFISASGIIDPPIGNTFDFNYIKNFQGSTVAYTVPSGSVLSSVVGVPSSVINYISATPTSLSFSAHIVKGFPGDEWWFFEKVGQTQSTILEFEQFKIPPYTVDINYPTEDCEKSIHIDGHYSITSGASTNTGDIVDFHFEILCNAESNSTYSPLVSSLEISPCFNDPANGPTFEVVNNTSSNGYSHWTGNTLNGMILGMNHHSLSRTPNIVTPTFTSNRIAPNRPGQIFRNLKALAVIDARYDSGNFSITNVSRCAWGTIITMIPNSHDQLVSSVGVVHLPRVSIPTNQTNSDLLNGLVEAMNSYYSNVIVFQTPGTNNMPFGEWLRNYLLNKRTIYQGINNELVSLVAMQGCC